MEKQTHTPGPWKFTRLPHQFAIYREDGSGQAIATVTREEHARLIAAAPELLAALQMSQTALRLALDGFMPDNVAKLIDINAAAIAKAEGR